LPTGVRTVKTSDCMTSGDKQHGICAVTRVYYRSWRTTNASTGATRCPWCLYATERIWLASDQCCGIRSGSRIGVVSFFQRCRTVYSKHVERQ